MGKKTSASAAAAREAARKGDGKFGTQDFAKNDGLVLPIDDLSQRMQVVFDENPELVAVAQAIKDATGKDAFLVGGSVRDVVSGADPKDLDITSPLAPQEFRDAVGGMKASVFDIGEEHGTTGITFFVTDEDGVEQRVDIEHTSHRAETYPTEGSRRPEVALGASLEEDLSRRDFTINAIAVNINTGEVFDPHNGVEDIENSIIRTPCDPEITMSDDPLRAYRAIRFAALRGFEIEPATGEAMVGVSDRFISGLSAERRRDEMKKVFKGGSAATAAAYEKMDELGIRAAMMEDFGSSQSKYTLTHRDLDADETLTALVMDAEDPEATLVRWKFQNNERRKVREVIEATEDLRPTSAANVRSSIRKHGVENLLSASRVASARGDISDFEAGRFERVVREQAYFADTPKLVDGKDMMSLGLKGKDVGAALADASEYQAENPNASKDEILNWVRSIQR
jgi:tRNA nucleotidyltransferase/poly(A) polymerase